MKVGTMIADSRVDSCFITLAWLAAVSVIFCSAVASADQRIPTENSPVSWQQDAELNDIFFLDSQLGWAVGSQGVILRTNNGGLNWKAIGEAVVESEQTLSLQQKLQAFQSGIRTSSTGIADGRSGPTERFRCRFESVFFIDENNGWVAGGYDIPYLDQSRGVILRTTDGGVTWRPLSGVTTPRIKRIRFTDPAHGWAVGEYGNLLPSGIFFTSDGGHSWSSNASYQNLPTNERGWKDADSTPSGFVTLTQAGVPLVVRENQFQKASFSSQTIPTVNCIRMINANQGWMVGQDGAVGHTTDGGRNWKLLNEVPDSPVSDLLKQFDFRAVAYSPTRVWFAGFPGSLIFSVDRNTGEIFSHSTGITTPINQLCFVDDQRGWFVGSLGTIVATEDGGLTWQIQRGNHRRVAGLGMSVDNQQIPLEFLASQAAEENKIIAVAILADSHNDSIVQAVERLGGSLTATLNDRPPQDTNAESRELEKMIRTIRSLKPNVIVCNSEFQNRNFNDDNRNFGSFEPDAFLQSAIRGAADRSVFPQQIEMAKLEPWQVDRVAIRSTMGNWYLDPQTMLLHNSCLIEDKIAVSRALSGLSPFHRQRLIYRVESFSAIRQTKDYDLFSGLSEFGKKIPHRSDQQRMRGNRNQIESANQKSRKLDELSRFQLTSPQDLQIWYQQIQAWTAPLDDHLAGTTLVQMAENYLTNGKIELAARSLESLLARSPGHPFESAALLWLAQYYSSDEFGLLDIDPSQNSLANNFEESQATSANETTTDSKYGQPKYGQPATQMQVEQKDGQTIVTWTPVADKIELPTRPRMLQQLAAHPSAEQDGLDTLTMDPDNSTHSDDVGQQDVAQTSHEGLNEAPPASGGDSVSDVQAHLNQRYQLGSRFLKRLTYGNPDLAKQPQYQQLEMRLTARLAGFPVVENGLKQMVQRGEYQSGISLAAQRELALENKRPGFQNDIKFVSVKTNDRPYLDGNLDDPIWQEIIHQGLAAQMPITINSRLQQLGGKGNLQQPLSDDLVMLAYDNQFLYVAARCSKLPNEYYQKRSETRPRDADLRQRDRIEFRIDTDRDYRTAFHFAVDHRGWCWDSLDNATGWNPEWYIASSEDNESWTIELAIPLKEITFSPPTADSVWAIDFSRRTREISNCWKPANAKSDHSAENSGFLNDLRARPAQFELLRFQ